MYQASRPLRRAARHGATWVAGILLLAPSLHAATVLFVDDDAPPGGDGRSWDTAYRFLQDALHEASGDAAVSEIRVAEGSYAPDRDETGRITPGDREATFQLVDGVALSGGYAGIAAADPDERDVRLHETILSGDLNGDDGPSFTGYAENSFHVVTATGAGPSAVLGGFTIAGGNADTFLMVGDSDCCESHDGPSCDDPACAALVCEQHSYYCCVVEWDLVCALVAIELCEGACPVVRHDAGAGMFCEAGTPAVSWCRFERNQAVDGAGVYAVDGSPAFRDCQFNGNRADLQGGGFRGENCDPSLTDCSFAMNEAQTGAGLYVLSGNATLVGCTVEGNSGVFAAGVFSGDGSPALTGCDFVGNSAGVVAGAFHNVGDAVLTDCTFIGNTTANQAGGAIYSYGDIVVSHCEFRNNAAGTNDTPYGDGGAIASINGRPTIIGSTFAANAASAQGGAIYNGYNGSLPPGSSPIVLNCLFVGNTAGAGGAVANSFWTEPIYVNCYFSGNTAFGGGASFNQNQAAPTFLACTFSMNSATNRGGAIASNIATTVTLANCILWGDDAPDGPEVSMSGAAGYPSIMTMSYCDVEGGRSGIDVGPVASLEWGDGNLAEDPLFIDPDGADGVAGTDDDDGRLLSGSPCIDAAHNNAIAGLVETDLGGNPRFADDPATADTGCGAPVIVDMGAYEFQGRPVTVRPGDIDGDGVVGIRDFLALLERWGPCPSGCCLADLNLDGGVDIPDFQLLLENWSAVKSR